MWGQPSPPHAEFADGLYIVRKKLPSLGGGDLGRPWYDVLLAYILVREAKDTIEGMSTEGKPRDGEKL
jgi:hypothetical protein